MKIVLLHVAVLLRSHMNDSIPVYFSCGYNNKTRATTLLIVLEDYGTIILQSHFPEIKNVSDVPEKALVAVICRHIRFLTYLRVKRYPAHRGFKIFPPLRKNDRDKKMKGRRVNTGTFQCHRIV